MQFKTSGAFDFEGGNSFGCSFDICDLEGFVVDEVRFGFCGLESLWLGFFELDFELWTVENVVGCGFGCGFGLCAPSLFFSAVWSFGKA